MQAITQTVEFGVLLTVGLYVLSHAVLKRTKITFLNPLMLSILLGVTFLVFAKIDVDDYRIGGHWVSFLLSPATVCLVIPFYKKSHLFKENWKPILAGIIAGTLAGLVVTVVLFQAFNMPEHIKHAILVKNSTTPANTEIILILNTIFFQSHFPSRLIVFLPCVHRNTNWTLMNTQPYNTHSFPRIKVTSGTIKLPEFE